MKKQEFKNRIIERIHSINKNYLDDLNLEEVPDDPEEFLSWVWNQAETCTNCVLCETRTKVVKPDGTHKAKIMVLGEGPGFMENLTGIPMVGPMELSGSRCKMCQNHLRCYDHKYISSLTDKFRKAKSVVCKPNMQETPTITHKYYIRSAGAIIDGILIKKWGFQYPRQNWIDTYNELHPEEPWTHSSPFYITNATMCRTTDSTGIKDAPPESVARQKCRRWLTYQWAAVNPTIILCLGRKVMGVIVGSEKKAETIRPNALVQTKYGPVIFQNHPAMYMRSENREVKALGFAKVASSFEQALAYCGYPV